MIRRAAALMRKRAQEATPGPWERPLDTRHKNIVGAALPDDEKPRHYLSGIIPEEFGKHPGYENRYAGQRERVSVVECPTSRLGSFERERNGRDLEYIAAMHPGVALAVAEWLEETARRAEGALTLQVTYGPQPRRWWCRQCERRLEPGGCTCWDGALASARAYLGEELS